MVRRTNLFPSDLGQFKLLADATPVVMWITNTFGYCVFFNKRWYEITGQAPESGLGLGWLAAVHPDDQKRLKDDFFDAKTHVRSFYGEYRLKFASGEYRWCIDIAEPLINKDGKFLGYIGCVLEVHKRKLAEAALINSNLRFKAALEAVEGVMWVTDGHGNVIEAQPNWAALTGQTFDEYRGLGWSKAIHHEDRDAYLQYCRDSLAKGLPFHYDELRLRSANGEYRLFSVRGVPVYNKDGTIREWVGVHTDITERREYEKQVEHLATHDSLTHLPNRVLLDERLTHLIHQRGHGQHVVMFMDLNRFKLINDSLSHEAGDFLLKEIAQRLVQAVRPSDTVARFGGDEFVVLIEDIHSLTDVARLANKILETLNKSIRLDGHDVAVSASIGISVYPRDGEDTSTLLKHADLAMYQAKGVGGSTFRFFDQQMNMRIVERLVMENELRYALDRNELCLFYHPQVDARGKTVGVEALLRWSHPTHGMIPPTDFIPLAEEIGLIGKIGEWALLHACRQRQHWQAAGLPPIRIAINVSVHQLIPSFVEAVRRTLAATQTDPEMVEFEITESALMKNIQSSEAILNDFKKMGIMLAIDDFGTGYSSLSYLKKLPIDILKIDQSFVSDLCENPDDAAIVMATIGLAKNMGLSIVAEGVVTEEQQDYLISKGCGIMQGFLYSRPLPPDHLHEFLAQHQVAEMTMARG